MVICNKIPINWYFIVQEKSFNYNPQIQISAESETKRSIFREKDKTKRSKKEFNAHMNYSAEYTDMMLYKKQEKLVHKTAA